MNFVAEKKVTGEISVNGEVVGFIDTVTMFGLETVASCLGSPFNFVKSWMPYIAMGQGATFPSTEDEHLENEKYRMEATVTSDGVGYIANAIFNAVATSFILREVSLLDKSAGGRMAARWSLDADVSVAAGDNVDITCTIYIA